MLTACPVTSADGSVLSQRYMAHLRYMLEEIRPEMRQYFFEDEKHGLPFSRDKRAVIYQRAKRVLDKRPFGTQYDVYAEGFEWLCHSLRRDRSHPSRSVSRSAISIAPSHILHRSSISQP